MELGRQGQGPRLTGNRMQERIVSVNIVHVSDLVHLGTLRA